MGQSISRPDPRYLARIAVSNGPVQTKPISSYTVNISTGGMFIEADKILPVDTLITLKFKLPDNSAVITGKARVAWTNEPGYSKKYRLPPGMGIQFIEYSQNDMHAVQDYLSKGTLEPTW